MSSRNIPFMVNKLVMSKIEKEIRNYSIEFRAPEEESRAVEGYGAVFNSFSEDLGGFREVIAPGAFDGVIERSDCSALLNHDNSRGILARCRKGSGSLKLSVDEHGLRFDFDAPKTALGDECLEYLRRGDADQCSFAFTVKEDSWRKLDDGMYERTINAFDRLFDVSILTCQPAYAATTVSCRSFEEAKAKIEAEEEEARKAEEERLAQEQREAEEKAAEELAEHLADYYNNIREENKKYLE